MKKLVCDSCKAEMFLSENKTSWTGQATEQYSFEIPWSDGDFAVRASITLDVYMRDGNPAALCPSCFCRLLVIAGQELLRRFREKKA